jgi:hypothetical protein
MEMIIVGLISGLGLILILLKMNFWKVLGFDIYVDIGATVLLMYLYMGTLGGMIAGMVGGLQVSIILLIVKKLWGHMSPAITRDGFKFSITWTPVPGLLYNKHIPYHKPEQQDVDPTVVKDILNTFNDRARKRNEYKNNWGFDK